MLTGTSLGKKTEYLQTYSPELLQPVPRSLGREKTGISSPLPFTGVDLWNGYELSWLAPNGKPQIAMARFHFPCDSENLVESKSFKLYLNSFNQTTFSSWLSVKTTLENDLRNVIGKAAGVDLLPPEEFDQMTFTPLEGKCLDDIPLATGTYTVAPHFLSSSGDPLEEKVYSRLLKSNCLATGQPDWGTILVHYLGPRIDHEGLLKYLISYRNHSGFAEHCVEQIYFDILQECRPKKLSILIGYTRRGGLDINPFRSNFENPPTHFRPTRQ